MFTNAGLFNAAMSTSSRSIASMAEKQYFPKFLGAVIPKLGTPWVAILIDCCTTCVLIALPFSTLIGAQTCINSFTMILLYVTFIYLRFRRKDMKRPYRVPLNNFLAILFCLFPIAICIWNLATAELTSKLSAVVAVVGALLTYPILCWREFKAFLISIRDKLRSCRTGKYVDSSEATDEQTSLVKL